MASSSNVTTFTKEWNLLLFVTATFRMAGDVSFGDGAFHL
ncbi:hypothetical protein L798_07725 [Zootermopsis nevadensis]|uniref:Uncharacterized protein n=1 Tax=Zootermopsis nevadensis TaxID=136037 RepID=A0A067R6Q9_ZOONE|nr:hypothetical protein L798_07725 [Zootermopsis nevadensis]